MPELRLYTYWRSSSSYRVRIALALKGLAYESIPINLAEGEQRTAAYRELSPTGFLPLLVVDGRPCGESVAIIELLNDLFPAPPLYPTDPWDRARVRALVEVVNSGTQPFHNLSVLHRVSPDEEARRAWARHFIGAGLASLERLMTVHHDAGIAGDYAFGSTITAADVFLVPQLYQADRFGVDLAPFPRVARAGSAAASLPAFQAAHPSRQPDAR